MNKVRDWCPKCNQPVRPGQWYRLNKNKTVEHLDCSNPVRPEKESDKKLPKVDYHPAEEQVKRT